MKATNAIAIGLILSSFALLGTWASTVGDVKTSGALRDAVSVSAATPCPYEDQSGGVGGQSGSCTFSCDVGEISVSVSADDEDAGVSGSGSCGDGSTHCTGEGSCTATDAVTEGGTGECSGDSDEAVDSGLYVNCSGNDPGRGGVTIPPVCQPNLKEEDSPRLCGVDADLSMHGMQFPLRACLIRDLRTEETLCNATSASDSFNETRFLADVVVHKFQGTETTRSAHLFVEKGLATGLVCWGLDCKQVLPSCAPIMANSTVTRCNVH